MGNLISIRTVSLLGAFLAALALAVFLIGGQVGSSAIASDENADGGDVKDFIGFWMGVDPDDGSFIKTSISDNDRDDVAEVFLHDTFSTVCGGERGIFSGSGMVDDDGNLVVDLEIQCVDEFGDPLGDPFLITVVYEPIGRNILELTSDDPVVLPITFHNVSVRD